MADNDIPRKLLDHVLDINAGLRALNIKVEQLPAQFTQQMQIAMITHERDNHRKLGKDTYPPKKNPISMETVIKIGILLAVLLSGFLGGSYAENVRNTASKVGMPE